jgi:hypothetical protein
LLFLLAPLLAAGPVMASGVAMSGTITINEATAEDFPNTVTFKAHLQGSARITRAVVEYGVERQTCGTVMAEGIAQFTPGTSVDVAWTWDMHKSGSEPPGARIWYRWRVTDEAGNESVSEKHTVPWLDSVHDWQSVHEGDLTLHWYEGSSDFAQNLLISASQSIAQLGRITGVVPQRPIDLYIYGSAADMRDAVLFQPHWTGGLAYPDYNIVLIGIAPGDTAWGAQSEAHELTHVLVGQLAFSCLGDIPTWLNEGIAMYGQGGPDPGSVQRFQRAIATNQLASLHVLSGSFSERADKADLAYAESYNVVKYLIDNYARDKLNALFKELARGSKVDDALSHVYGFGLDRLEADWRGSIGAKPAQSGGGTAATPVPTPVPTFSISNAPPSLTAAVEYTKDAGSPDPQRLFLAALAIIVPIGVVGAGAYLTLRRSRRS